MGMQVWVAKPSPVDACAVGKTQKNVLRNLNGPVNKDTRILSELTKTNHATFILIIVKLQYEEVWLRHLEWSLNMLG